MITPGIKTPAILELRKSVEAALQTYSNVHRGSGHYSQISTHLYEQARDLVLDFLGLTKRNYVLVFCNARRAKFFTGNLTKGTYQIISSGDYGLALGVCGVAVKKSNLPKGAPYETGGGTTKLIAADWEIWASEPDRYEAGTPAIINVIAFAKALALTKRYGSAVFKSQTSKAVSPTEILYSDDFDGASGYELLRELRKTLVGRNLAVPTTGGQEPFINLDNSASTRTFQPIWQAFQKCILQSDLPGPELIVQVKQIIREFISAPPNQYDVLFTTNTTEAINLAADNLQLLFPTEIKQVVLTTTLEHTSNDLPWRRYAEMEVIRLKVDNDGFIDTDELEAVLSDYNEKKRFGKKRISMVAVNGASNVLGVCNDIGKIAAIAHRHSAKVLVDAAQLIAHRKINMQAADIDFLAFSAHKVYAPFGSGALIAKHDLLRFHRDELSEIRASGEENLGGIAALGKSMLLLNRIGMQMIEDEERMLTERTLEGLAKIDSLRLFGLKTKTHSGFSRKLGVIVFDKKIMTPKSLANKLAQEGGIGVRYGCHCAHIIVKQILGISPGLETFQRWIQLTFPRLKLQGVVRVSFGLENSVGDVDRFLDKISAIVQPSKNKLSEGGDQEKSMKQTRKEIKEFIAMRSKMVFD